MITPSRQVLSRCPFHQLSMSRFHLRPMIFNMCFGRFRSVVHCMFVVAASEVRVMRSRLVFSCFVVLGGFFVMACRVFVMLCCFVMMLDRFL